MNIPFGKMKSVVQFESSIVRAGIATGRMLKTRIQNLAHVLWRAPLACRLFAEGVSSKAGVETSLDAAGTSARATVAGEL
jgi:hypothetical protein